MSLLESILRSYATLVHRHSRKILAFFFLITFVVALGIGNIELESDINEQMPQHLPIFKLNDRIENKFSGQDTIFLLFMLDDDLNVRETPKDILDPVIMEYLLRIEPILERESKIDSVVSIRPVIEAAKQQDPDLSISTVSEILRHSPQSEGLVSDDRKKMIVMLRTNVGNSEKETEEINELIHEKIDALSTPPGTNIMVTGQAPVMSTILDLLRYDSVYTLIVAFILIFPLIIVVQKSLRRALMISVSLFLALLLTGGTLGWLNIKISFATAGLGAMVLGLGVEYGVFMLTRYREERGKDVQIKALKEAIPRVGSAIIGSGSTTMIGFLALTLSIIPMMQNLGLTLAIGIFYCIISSVIVLPAIIINDEALLGVEK